MSGAYDAGEVSYRPSVLYKSFLDESELRDRVRTPARSGRPGSYAGVRFGACGEVGKAPL